MDLHRELGLWFHDPRASLASLVPDSRRRGCLSCPGRITGARLVCSMCLPGPRPPLCYWMIPIKGSERSRYAVVLGVSITNPLPPSLHYVDQTSSFSAQVPVWALQPCSVSGSQSHLWMRSMFFCSWKKEKSQG